MLKTLQRKTRRIAFALAASIIMNVMAVGAAFAQDFAAANAINNRGQIAGGSTGTGIIFDAFLLVAGEFRALGTFGGPTSIAFGINSRGDVVGESDLSALSANGVDYISHAFLADHDGVHDLGTLPEHTNSTAYAINNRGQVVGFSWSWDPQRPSRVLLNSRAFLYERGEMKDLGTLGGTTSVAFGINDRGQIVGSARIASGPNHAFLYENGRMIDLGTLAGYLSSQARAINNRGQIAGTSFTPSGQSRAFLYYDGVMVDIGTLGGPSSRAWAINDRGEIVGESVTAGGELHAFLYRDGAMIDLGTLGGSYSVGFAINDRGDIVGMSETATGDVHAFLYKDGVMHDLGALP